MYHALEKYGKNNLKEYNQLLDSKIFYRKFGSIESEICVFSTGPISYNVFEAIINTNINILHIHIPFLKNIEQNNIELLCKSCKKILVYEEHSKFGGLFSALSPIFLKSVFFKNVEIINFGINNSFLHKYGSQEDVWKYYKLDTNSIIETLIKYK
jgi:transketolase C-terminal domain/subunit